MKLIFAFLASCLIALIVFNYYPGEPTLPKVKLTTNHGDIVIELDSDKAPNTVANFVEYVEADFYNGTIFHRIIENFMIQGGGFDEDFNQKDTNAEIDNEANNGLSNVRGSIAMARTQRPHSASSQFFINTVDNDFLNFRSESFDGWGYAVFGQVIEGMDVVDEIRQVSTGSKGHHQNVPNDNVIIIDASMID